MTLQCSQCKSVCRIPSLPKGRVRCGMCKHIFTPQELVHAVPEAPPARQIFDDETDNDDFALDPEDDFDPDEDND